MERTDSHERRQPTEEPVSGDAVGVRSSGHAVDPVVVRRLGLRWGALAVGVLALAPFAPWLASWLWSCPFKELTGWPCPACGMTRAALALGRLEVVEALVRYPLQTLGWIGFVGGGLVSGAAALLGRPLPILPLPELPRWVVALLLTLVLANWGYCIATGV